ncbi:hypothetical protein HK405_001673 [Cladochytrium tenue]|nr:hypothetical protein HK405_001673 [Cladochytrium tenue]
MATTPAAVGCSSRIHGVTTHAADSSAVADHVDAHIVSLEGSQGLRELVLTDFDVDYVGMHMAEEAADRFDSHTIPELHAEIPLDNCGVVEGTEDVDNEALAR